MKLSLKFDIFLIYLDDFGDERVLILGDDMFNYFKGCVNKRYIRGNL